MIKKIVVAYVLAFFAFSVSAQGNYEAFYTDTPPVIDGQMNDPIWNKNDKWYTYHQVWLNNVGTTPSAADFSWRYKLAWDENRFYILAEITDDVLRDAHPNPLTNYWEDDCFEVFFDEDKSGGNHQNSYQAFAYHISLTYDVVDIDNAGNSQLLNDHVNVRMDTVNGKYVWEAAFKVFDKNFHHSNAVNTPVTLTAGKKMGWGLAYCDNDGGNTRQHFFGSETVEGTDKNRAYITADVFGEVTLINPSIPTFSHVLVANGLNNPTAMTIASNGDIYVTEQAGRLRVIKNGVLQTQSLVNLNVNLDGTGGYTERGLLGLALDPHFHHNNYIYLFYTTADGGVHNRVSRFTLNGTANATASEQMITELDLLSSANNHNGGALHFGTDGKLYIATGDNATPSNAQTLTNSHGKLLRINADGSTPTDNPFYNNDNADKRIWAYGLRNPFTFDISKEGKILVNDVGQTGWEEMNDATEAGRNFGWPTVEGVGSNTLYTNPIYAYKNVYIDTPNGTFTDSTGCAITGGCVFDPLYTNYPTRYLGKYFFMDYCGDWINVTNQDGSGRETFASKVSGSPVAIDAHPDGNLYYLSRDAASVHKVVYSGDPIPFITKQPTAHLSVAETQPFILTVSVNGVGPFSFQWYKDGDTIQGATSNSYSVPSAIPANAGEYTVVVSNAFASVESEIAHVEVTAPNTRPVAIISPLENNSFRGGQTFVVNGSATDAEDGILGGEHMAWYVDLYHGNHVHDGIPTQGQNQISFTIPIAGGHTETNVWYRISLVVTDKGGLKDTTYVEIFPELVTITLNSQPTGLRLELDGQSVTTPYVFENIRGVQRTLSAPAIQNGIGKAYAFQSWNHSAENMNNIIPNGSMGYTANFEEVPLLEETLATIRDAYVQFTSYAAGDAASTYGVVNPNQLLVKNFSNTPNREIYLAFDLRQLSGNKDKLVSARLVLHGNMIDEAPNPSLQLHVYEAVSSDWGENTITWNNKPAKQNTSLASITLTELTFQAYIWDISNYLQSAIESDKEIITLVIASTSDHFNRVVFNSKESGENVPQLLLEYGIATANQENSLTDLVLEIYPNPVGDRVVISGSVISPSWKLLTVLGEEIMSGIGKEVDCSKLNSGLYFLETEGTIMRLVKE